MRALLQRVSSAAVRIDGAVVGQIGLGLTVLAAAAPEDADEDLQYVAEKLLNMRIFSDDDGRFNLSVIDVGGQILLVSQFTLYADTRRGRRPSFTDAAPPEKAEPMLDRFADMLRANGTDVQTGRFGASMQVEIHNDGPVTIMVDSAERHRPRRG